MCGVERLRVGRLGRAPCCGEGACNVKTITPRVNSDQSDHKLCATAGWNFMVSQKTEPAVTAAITKREDC